MEAIGGPARRRSCRLNGRPCQVLQLMYGHMRVALLSFDFPQYCIRLANGLAQAAEVLLLLPQDESGPYKFGLDPKVQVVDLDAARLREPLAQARMVRSALKRIREFDPDVIHYQAGHLWFNLIWPF